LFELAVKLDPTNTVAHFRLSALYRKMGGTDDAEAQIQEYKDMKEKLRELYRQMSLRPGKEEQQEDSRQ
jgi:hypothetical protein